MYAYNSGIEFSVELNRDFIEIYINAYHTQYTLLCILVPLVSHVLTKVLIATMAKNCGRNSFRGVQPLGVSGPHWKKKSCPGPHIKYTNTNQNR